MFQINFILIFSLVENTQFGANLEFFEALLGTSTLCYFQHVETYCLRDWSAFTNRYNITNFNISENMQKVKFL